MGTRDIWPEAPSPLPHPVMDNHTHFDVIESTQDRGVPPRSVSEQVELAAAVGVDAILDVGCDWDTAALAVARAQEFAAVVAGVGIHPNEAVLHERIIEATPDGLSESFAPRHELRYEEAFARIVDLATHPQVRAISETGLDYYRAGERGREVQKRAFRDHLALARETGLPLQIHDRQAHAECLEILDADGAPAVTVFHCFSGDAEFAAQCLRRGFYLSVAGTLTFPRSEALQGALRRAPLGQLLVETDAPFMAPVPYRGHPNAPYLLPATVRALALLRGEQLPEVCATVAQTSALLYLQER